MTRREVGDLEQVRGPAGNEQVFPFGRPSTPRGPRTPSGQAGLFVLGVYPSALHVRWEPPAWARRDLGISAVAALAVDDEPSVFWDGADAVDRVSEWRADVGFLEGDEEGRWGRVRPAGNGTSGRSVVEGVLSPLGIESESTWFSDAVDLFFIKRAGGGRQRQQADAIAEDYEPFARATGLPSASLPLRPTVADLVDLAVSGHRERLRTELVRSRSPLVVTLGEEARRVLAAVADEVEGGPTRPLDGKRFAEYPDDYGEAGALRVGGMTAQWLALVHPGQRSPRWQQLHGRWRSLVRREAG